MTTPQQHELTADELVDEDVIRSYYMQVCARACARVSAACPYFLHLKPFMFFVHANIVINLLTW